MASLGFADSELLSLSSSSVAGDFFFNILFFDFIKIFFSFFLILFVFFSFCFFRVTERKCSNDFSGQISQYLFFFRCFVLAILLLCHLITSSYFLVIKRQQVLSIFQDFRIFIYFSIIRIFIYFSIIRLF